MLSLFDVFLKTIFLKKSETLVVVIHSLEGLGGREVDLRNKN